MNSSLSLSNLEENEDLLIQHIRTSGLRKARETSLIDEIISIRKIRRQIFTNLLDKINELSIEIETINNNNTINKNDMSTLVKVYDEKYASYKSTLNNEMTLYKEKIKIQAQQSKDKLIKTASNEIKSMKKTYEDKINKLSIKLNELIESKQNTNDINEKKIMQIENNLHLKYSNQLKSYQTSILEIKNKEPELKKNMEILNERNKLLEKKILLLESNTLQSKDIINQLNNELNSEKDKNINYLNTIKLLEKDKEVVQLSHEKQLAEIDNRVRLLVNNKDDTMKKQLLQLQSLELKNKKFEQMFQELNEGFSNSNSSSSSSSSSSRNMNRTMPNR